MHSGAFVQQRGLVVGVQTTGSSLDYVPCFGDVVSMDKHLSFSEVGQAGAPT